MTATKATKRKGRIVIVFPPDFDGELHIDWTEVDRAFEYKFTNRKDKTENAWTTLVEVARGILAQEDRKLRSLHR